MLIGIQHNVIYKVHQILESEGKFTWNFNNKYYIECNHRNFEYTEEDESLFESGRLRKATNSLEE